MIQNLEGDRAYFNWMRDWMRLIETQASDGAVLCDGEFYIEIPDVGIFKNLKIISASDVDPGEPSSELSVTIEYDIWDKI